MENETYYYPDHLLKRHYNAALQYMHRLNWNAISAEIKEKGPIHFDVSDAISLFPHLELDENYKLRCYLSSEYHGIWGRVAAVEIGAPEDPVVCQDDFLTKLFLGQHFELPENAAPPLEAVYNDGSPEGYFEAVLCDWFLYALPYVCFERKNWDIVATKPPADIETAWNTYEQIPDWRPRVRINRRTGTVLVLRHRIENGIGSSSGQDEIYLTQCNFCYHLAQRHAFAPKENRSMCKGQIDNDRRYTDQRHCSVFLESSVLIAEEKVYTGKEDGYFEKITGITK